jgi:hypothetical protein
MNRYFGWLAKPLPSAKAWWLLYAYAFGMFVGSWMQAFDGAAQRGHQLSWQSHIIFLAPVWAMWVGLVVMMVRHDRQKAKGGVA